MTRHHMVTPLVVVVFFSACATGPGTEELDARVRGMTKQQLLSCMGPPQSQAKEGNMDFLTYSHRDFYDKYMYRCDANFILTDGRVSKLNVTGDAPGTLDVTSRVCNALVARCLK